MQRRLILVGAILVWLLFVASFLMPVMKGADGLIGWQAFSHYVTEVWDWPDYWRQIGVPHLDIPFYEWPRVYRACRFVPLAAVVGMAGWLSNARRPRATVSIL